MAVRVACPDCGACVEIDDASNPNRRIGCTGCDRVFRVREAGRGPAARSDRRRERPAVDAKAESKPDDERPIPPWLLGMIAVPVLGLLTMPFLVSTSTPEATTETARSTATADEPAADEDGPARDDTAQEPGASNEGLRSLLARERTPPSVITGVSTNGEPARSAPAPTERRDAESDDGPAREPDPEPAPKAQPDVTRPTRPTSPPHASGLPSAPGRGDPELPSAPGRGAPGLPTSPGATTPAPTPTAPVPGGTPALPAKERLWTPSTLLDAKRWASGSPHYRDAVLGTRDEAWYTSAPRVRVEAAPGELVVGIVPVGRESGTMSVRFDVYRVISIEGETASLENRYGRVTGVPGLFIHRLEGLAQHGIGKIAAGTPTVVVAGRGYYDGCNVVVIASVTAGAPGSFISAWDDAAEPLKGVGIPIASSGIFSRVAFPKVEEHGRPVGIIVAEHGDRVWLRRKVAAGGNDVIVVRKRDTRPVREATSFRVGQQVFVHRHGKWRTAPVTKVPRPGFYEVDGSTLRWHEVFAAHPETGVSPDDGASGKKRSRRSRR